MPGNGQPSSCQGSQGRLPRHFHPSRRIVPYPRKKNASLLVRKPPLFVLALRVLNDKTRSFDNTGVFTSCPRVFPLRLSVKAFCQGVKVPSPGIFDGNPRLVGFWWPIISRLLRFSTFCF
ncbi:unnamed protein product [Laminaria digitata]